MSEHSSIIEEEIEEITFRWFNEDRDQTQQDKYDELRLHIVRFCCTNRLYDFLDFVIQDDEESHVSSEDMFNFLHDAFKHDDAEYLTFLFYKFNFTEDLTAEQAQNIRNCWLKNIKNGKKKILQACYDELTGEDSNEEEGEGEEEEGEEGEEEEEAIDVSNETMLGQIDMYIYWQLDDGDRKRDRDLKIIYDKTNIDLRQFFEQEEEED